MFREAIVACEFLEVFFEVLIPLKEIRICNEFFGDVDERGRRGESFCVVYK